MEDCFRLVVEHVREEELQRRGEYEFRFFVPARLEKQLDHGGGGPLIINNASTLVELRQCLVDDLLWYGQRYDFNGERCMVHYTSDGLSSLLDDILPKLSFYYTFDVSDTEDF